MTNHVHLVLVPQQADSLAKLMRYVQMRYAQYRNAIEQTNGHLWQGRYYSCAFEWNRLATVLSYVERNPLRAGLVSDAAAYEWSTAAVHLGCADRWNLVTLRDWRNEWSTNAWRAVLRHGLSDVGAIREATYGGRPLGSNEFVASLEAGLQRKLTRGPFGRPKKKQEAAAV